MEGFGNGKFWGGQKDGGMEKRDAMLEKSEAESWYKDSGEKMFFETLDGLKKFERDESDERDERGRGGGGMEGEEMRDEDLLATEGEGGRRMFLLNSCSFTAALENTALSRLVCSFLRALLWFEVTHRSHMTFFEPGLSLFHTGVKSEPHWTHLKGLKMYLMSVAAASPLLRASPSTKFFTTSSRPNRATNSTELALGTKFNSGMRGFGRGICISDFSSCFRRASRAACCRCASDWLGVARDDCGVPLRLRPGYKPPIKASTDPFVEGWLKLLFKKLLKPL